MEYTRSGYICVIRFEEDEVQGVVRPTLEVSLQIYPQPLERVIDPKFGLPTLSLASRYL